MKNDHKLEFVQVVRAVFHIQVWQELIAGI